MSSISNAPIDARNASHQAAQQLEALLTQKMLEATGAFKGSGEAGSSQASGLFVEALADAVARSGGLGLAKQLESQLPQAVSHAPVKAPVKDVTHELIAHPARVEEKGSQS
jgi:Rod binding domain-containing protein